jgi:hypothetical protein
VRPDEPPSFRRTVSPSCAPENLGGFAPVVTLPDGVKLLDESSTARAIEPADPAVAVVSAAPVMPERLVLRRLL